MRFIVYCIYNTFKHEVYVGSSAHHERRWKEHIYLLNTNKHHCPHLQHSWGKYGEDTFKFEILEETEPLDAVLRHQEQSWMDMFKDLGYTLYNVCPTAGSCLGQKRGPRSEEDKLKISKGNFGKKRSDETKQKLRILSTGQSRHTTPHSEESKQKMKIAHTGIIQSDATLKKRSESSKGRIDSEETRRKKSERMKGSHPSNETKQKIRESLTGRCVPDEEKQKISENSKGRKWVTNGIKNKFVCSAAIDILIKEGYWFGITQKRRI